MANPWRIDQPHKDGLWDRNDDWLLSGLLPGGQKGTVVFYGGFGSFKSTIVASLIGAQLNDQPFLGMPSEGGKGLTAAWVALEDARGTVKRFAGWSSVNGWTRVPDVVSGGRLNVRNANERTALVDALFGRRGFVGSEVTGGFDYLVIDTAQRAGGVFDPLDAAQVSAVCDGVEALREELDAYLAILITHSGKDVGAGVRGSSAWYDGPLLVARIERTGKTLTGRLVIEKDRCHGREGQAFGFRVDYVDVRDPGDEYSRAAIPIVSAAATEPPLVSTATRHKSKLLEIVAAAAPDGGPVPLAEIRKQFGRALTEQGVDTRHQGTRYKEALNALVTAGTLKVDGDHVASAVPALANDD